MEDRISIIENTLIQLSKSLSSSLVLLTGADEAASNNISDLQRSLGLIEEDVNLTKIQLQNLSSMYTDLQSDYNATTHDIHTIRADTELNTSQLYDRIHQVEKNHSSSLIKLSRRLDKAAMNSSILIQMVKDTSKLVTEVQDSVTGLHDTLTTDINNLNTCIDDHMKWSKDHLVKLSRRLDEAAVNNSMLTQRIEDTSKLVGSQGQTIHGIRSDVTAVQKSVSGIRDKLTTNVDDLVTRIDDHVKWSRDQHSG